MKTNLDYCIEVLEDCADYDTFTEEQRLHSDAWWKAAVNIKMEGLRLLSA